MLVAAVLVLSSHGAAEVKMEAEFETYYNGASVEQSSFDRGGLLPGDKGLWVVDLNVNESAELYVVLKLKDEAENNCIEPEEETPCTQDGELDEALQFSAFEDEGGDLDRDSEQLFQIQEGTVEKVEASSGGDFDGGDHTVVVNWSFPNSSGVDSMTDSATYDLTVGANSSSYSPGITTTTIDSGDEDEDGDGSWAPRRTGFTVEDSSTTESTFGSDGSEDPTDGDTGSGSGDSNKESEESGSTDSTEDGTDSGDGTADNTESEPGEPVNPEFSNQPAGAIGGGLLLLLILASLAYRYRNSFAGYVAAFRNSVGGR